MRKGIRRNNGRRKDLKKTVWKRKGARHTEIKNIYNYLK
jgi:hypothetical protein